MKKELKKVIALFILIILVFTQVSTVYGANSIGENTLEKEKNEIISNTENELAGNEQNDNENNETEETNEIVNEEKNPEVKDPDTNKNQDLEKTDTSVPLEENEEENVPMLFNDITTTNDEIKVSYQMVEKTGEKIVSTINTQEVNEEEYLFLPSAVDLQNLNLHFEAEEGSTVTIVGKGKDASEEILQIEINQPFDLTRSIFTNSRR